MAGDEARAGERRKVRVWDRPIRIFHWALVALFGICYASASFGLLDVHIMAGKVLLVMVVARVLWGFLGSDSARFLSFVRPLREIFAYLPGLLKRSPDDYPGHNPLGGLSVVAMLLVLVAQVGLGFFAIDIDGLYEGPLGILASYETARAAAGWHGAVVIYILLGLVGLHLAAVAFHLFYKRENLVTPLVTGWATLPAAKPPRLVPDWRALLVLALAAALVFGGIELFQRYY